jgi:hypothetical protein
MLRAIAYGSELNMAYPPRPTDPKVAWEPDWNIKIRVKSMSTSVIGMDGSGMGGMDAAGEQDEIGDAPAPDAEAGAPPAGEEPKKKKKFSAFDALKEVAKEVVP